MNFFYYFLVEEGKKSKEQNKTNKQKIILSLRENSSVSKLTSLLEVFQKKKLKSKIK